MTDVTLSTPRVAALPGYEPLAAVHDQALEQAQAGKGAERHAGNGEAFVDQQIVQLGEWPLVVWLGTMLWVIRVTLAHGRAIAASRRALERGTALMNGLPAELIQRFGLPVLRFTGSEIFADAVSCGRQIMEFFEELDRREEQERW